jgi:hypothetical protein
LGSSWSWSHGSWVYNILFSTKILSLNPAYGEVFSIQHYVIKFVCDLLAAGRLFSRRTPVSSTNKTDRRDKTEILLKVVLNTINQTNIEWILRWIYYYSWILRRVLLTIYMLWQYHDIRKPSYPRIKHFSSNLENS